MKKNISIIKSLSKKRLIAISSFVVLIFLLTLLNYTFSAFTNRSVNNITNIKVAEMEYSLTINGISETKIMANKNDITKSNIVISSLNDIDSKYELVYKICSDSTCTSFIQKPDDLIIEYSSKTIDSITGVITSNGSKQIRIITINNTNTNYYIKLDINAGYIHNTLALENLINIEYNEEDIIIAATIDGEVSTTFPTIQGDYLTTVICLTNDGPSNASGTVAWNGTKWILNVSGVDSGRTVCNVEFKEPPLYNKIIAQGGGIDTIVARGTPNFNENNVTSSIYATEDEYGTSYYYRGLKTDLNNNLIWGGFQWKIVRINGDGSVRLVYNGTESQFNTNWTVNDTGTNIRIDTNSWNTINHNDNKYLGYMYGGSNGTVSTLRNGLMSAAATYNETSSNIKTIIDNWYIVNIKNKSFEVDVVDSLFCNDRQLQSEVGGSSTGTGIGTSETYYAAYYRIYANKIPTLKCAIQNDRFTVSDTNIGNGSLTYSIGLLSADEALMAGVKSINDSNYLYTNISWLLFSPFSYSNNYANIGTVSSMGNISFGVASFIYGVRPSISITGEIKVSGDGSATNPFIVK